MDDRYRHLYDTHRWEVPADFNIARACGARWADGSGRLALITDSGGGGADAVQRHDFDSLWAEACRLAQALRGLGVQPGERVALVLPQGHAMAVSYLGVLGLGAVAMPLSTLFGPEALAFRLADSGARVAIADARSRPVLESVRGTCPELSRIIEAGPAGDWRALLDAAPAGPPALVAGAADPAVLIYTSGTTGAPKGALIPHRALLGNLSGFVLSQDGFPRADDVFWSPADWAWTGGLMDALLPALYFGRPIVGSAARFDPVGAFALLERHAVTNTFLFPTALKMMMKAVPEPRAHHRLALRAIMSAGEAVGTAVFDWCRSALGITVNEMFGQTEVNYLVGNASRQWPARPGSIGRPYPGHRVAVLDDAGQICAPGQVGDIAVHRRDVHGDPDPVFFLGYWRRDDATAAKYTGDWCRTGDLAHVDTEGYLWYQGRADDMFKAAGYRIGPGEIENCLVRHPAVANAAVVPKPDATRGYLVKAYVVLAPGAAAGAALVAELQEFVRGQLAPYEYPKEIEFIAALPMTTTGKVQRRVLRLREEELARQAGAT